MKRLGVTTIALAFLCEACSSSYQPARSPRIAVVQEGLPGIPTLVRDGQTYSVGLFGGGLVDAVQGNPAAEEHASTYRTLSIAGWSAYVAGLGSSVAGLILLGSDNTVGGSDNDTAGAALALGGVAALVTSLVLLMNAQPHVWDAVNIYNDGVDASFAYPVPPPQGWVRPPPPPAQSAAPPASSAAPAAPPPPATPPPAPSGTPPQ